MRALLPLLLLVGCAPQDEPAAPHSITPEVVAEVTTERRETLALAEYAYGAASLAVELKIDHADAEQLARLEDYEVRAHDALAYLRTLEKADAETFTWGVYFFNTAIRELNMEIEGHAHH